MRDQIETRYPLTLRDYGFIDDVFDDDYLKHESADEVVYYVNPRIVEAHRLILDDCVNPYAAWMRALFKDEDDFPEILGLSKRECDLYLKRPNASPPADNVRRFCDRLGIHPAYLLPGLRENNYSYHYTVLKVIADVLDDETAPYKDRKLSLAALRSEQERYARFKQQKPQIERHFGNAVCHFKMKSSQAPLRQSLSGIFGQASISHGQNIDFILDEYGAHLKTENERLYRKTFTERDRLSAANDRLQGLAKIIYGKVQASGALAAVISDIEKLNKANTHVPYSFWRKMHETFMPYVDEKEVRRKIGEKVCPVSMPKMDPDFELEAKKAGLRPRAVRQEFLRVLETYFSENNKARKADRDFELNEQKLKKFDGWRQHVDSERCHIPLYQNAELIRSYINPIRVKTSHEQLPQQLPSQNQPQPVQ